MTDVADMTHMAEPYRVSTLASAFVKMWRAWRLLVPVVLANAVIQSLLIWPVFTYGSGMWGVLSAVASAIVMAAGFAVIAICALRVADGPVHWSAVASTLRACGWRLALWTAIWGIAFAVGLALYVIPGVIVIALTPFLPLAVVDGQAQPLRVNVEVLRARLARWLVTVLLVLCVLVVGWNISGFVAFFLRGPLASMLVWLVGGWLIAWFTTAFGLIYRSARSPVAAS